MRPYTSSSSFQGSPTLVLVAPRSISDTRARFLMPSRVAATASASPTASVSSPGSDPLLPSVEKRRNAFSSCSRAHLSSVGFSSSEVRAFGIGLYPHIVAPLSYGPIFGIRSPLSLHFCGVRQYYDHSVLL